MKKNIIFINHNLDLCIYIKDNKNENKNELISVGELDILIKSISDKDDTLIVLSSLISYSNKLLVPKKNRSVFKKNAKEIIIQKNIINQKNNTLVQSQNGEYLPYIISDQKKISEINQIFTQNNIENIPVILEKNIGLNDNQNWFVLIKSLEEICICHNHTILQTNKIDLYENIEVILKKYNLPKNIDWYSFDSNVDIHLILDDLKKTKNSIADVNHSINEKISEFLSFNRKQLQLDDLSDKKDSLFNITNNWKLITLLVFSATILLSLVFQYINMISYENRVEIRKNNILNFTFSNHEEKGSEKDLIEIRKGINQSSHLPEINHIDSLNLIGSLLNVDGIKIKKIYLENNTIEATLLATSNSVISTMNNALQENSEVIYEIKSIENEINDDIIINIVFNLVGEF